MDAEEESTRGRMEDEQHSHSKRAESECCQSPPPSGTRQQTPHIAGRWAAAAFYILLSAAADLVTAEA